MTNAVAEWGHWVRRVLFLKHTTPHTHVPLWTLLLIAQHPPLPSLPITFVLILGPNNTLLLWYSFFYSSKIICSLAIWISLQSCLYIVILTVFCSFQLSTTPTADGGTLSVNDIRAGRAPRTWWALGTWLLSSLTEEGSASTCDLGELEDITLSEISQSQKYKCCTIPCV